MTQKEERIKAAVRAEHQRLLEKAFTAIKNSTTTTVGFSDTGYFLPLIYSVSEEKITSRDELSHFLTSLVSGKPPYTVSFSEIERLSFESLLFLELLEVLPNVESEGDSSLYTGFIGDTVLRKLGVPLVDGSITGIALLSSKIGSDLLFQQLIKTFQSNGILILAAGTAAKFLVEAEEPIGLEKLIVPLGKAPSALIFALNLLVRIALSFGGIKAGETEKLFTYLKTKVPAFVLVGESKEQPLEVILEGVHLLGLPIIQYSTKENDSRSLEEVVQNLVNTCFATQGIKPKTDDFLLPIDYGFAFEGQAVRKKDLFVEFGGSRSPAFELLVSLPAEELNDGQITFLGQDVDELQPGMVLPLAIIVKVAGNNMKEEFEPVLERQIHHYINFGDGLWHNAQRDIIWLRISKKAVSQGFKIKHIADILVYKLRTNFTKLIDKIEITLITDLVKVKEYLPKAQAIYHQRDQRLKNLSDDSVVTFYSCLLCQSFAPNHVCIITPERTGLCGAVSWLDARTSFELNPTGGNQPVVPGTLIDGRFGCWEGVNSYLFKESHGTIREVCLYSIMKNPLTSCGCFECIAAIIPETNGILIVNREYQGITPLGLSFSSLAGAVGGGIQTPGFLGIGKSYITSKKFLLAEGGVKRIVWMPHELKLTLQEDLEAVAPGLVEKIADEKQVTTLEELLAFLQKVNHPVLRLEPML
ncbi:MAG: acetyl-CoA decarbonylase/synthase complex subunit alpha/beta [Candidatus Heimdallarchaeota archaeon]